MGVINEFQALMSRAQGFARPTRYQVMLTAPQAINFPNYDRNISLMCDTIAMPGHDLQTHSAKYGTGLETMMANGHGFEGTIEATFYLDTNFETQSYFSLWQHAAVDNRTNKVRYLLSKLISSDSWNRRGPILCIIRCNASFTGGYCIFKNNTKFKNFMSIRS